MVFIGFWRSLVPADLKGKLRQLGWDITVRATGGPCYWGAGGA
jgi:hypothetical protein